ncbi:hypothetical protein QBC45DRAFT_332720, partial [Copromyces sp. CBS 386.78]
VNNRRGTSKSYFIRLLFYKFRKIATNLHFPNFITYTIPISVVINNIKSSILYSFFKLLYNISNLVSLEGYKYFIINKKFILGIRNIYFINNRLY